MDIINLFFLMLNNLYRMHSPEKSRTIRRIAIAAIFMNLCPESTGIGLKIQSNFCTIKLKSNFCTMKIKSNFYTIMYVPEYSTAHTILKESIIKRDNE